MKNKYADFPRGGGNRPATKTFKPTPCFEQKLWISIPYFRGKPTKVIQCTCTLVWRKTNKYTGATRAGGKWREMSKKKNLKLSLNFPHWGYKYYFNRIIFGKSMANCILPCHLQEILGWKILWVFEFRPNCYYPALKYFCTIICKIADSELEYGLAQDLGKSS